MIKRAGIVFFFLVCTCCCTQSGYGFEPNWDGYAFRTITSTSTPGDTISWTIQGVSHLMCTRNNTWWDMRASPPVQMTYVDYLGYYSDKSQRYAITAEAFPASGSYAGFFRANWFNIYLYSTCDDYEAGQALPLWKPEQSHPITLSGSGNYLGSPCDLMKLRFRGYNDSTELVREMYVNLKIWDYLPAQPPDPPGDPDFEFKPFYEDDEGPPGDDWPPEPDDFPPYDGEESADDENMGKRGFGSCLIYGLPLYQINAADLSLWIRDRMFRYTSLGPDPDFYHTFRSSHSGDGMLGRRWSFSMDSRLTGIYGPRAYAGPFVIRILAPDGVWLQRGNGERVQFWKNATNESDAFLYDALDPLDQSKLWLNTNSHVWTLEQDSPRLTYTFSATGNYANAAMGRLQSIADPAGNTLSVEYRSSTNPSERAFWSPVSVTDAVGRDTHFRYNEEGLCTNMLFPHGGSVDFLYDTNAWLTGTVDLAGNQVEYHYHPTLCDLVQMESAGKTIKFDYQYTGSLHVISRVIDPLGRTNEYTLISSNETRQTDAAGYVTVLRVNEDKMPVYMENAAGEHAQMQYEKLRPASVMMPNGGVLQLVYDTNGNCTAFTDAEGHTRTQTFDDQNRLTRLTNAVGQVTSFSYGPQDELLSITRPSGARLTYGYTGYGQLAVISNAVGSVTRMEYDAFGNVARYIDAEGAVTAYGYDAYGIHRTSVTNPNGHATSYAYDANGRLTEVIYADGTSLQFQYDCCVLTNVVDAYGRSHFLFRNDDLYISKLSDPGKPDMLISYNAAGQQVGVSNTAGQQASASFDEVGRPVVFQTAMGRNDVAYDAMWNVTGLSNASGSAMNYTYTSNSYPASDTDPLGRVVTYQRDALNRLTRIDNADGSMVQSTYTADGNLASLMVGADSTYTFDYNAAGWLTRYSSPLGNVYLHYDAVGRVVRLDYPGGLSVLKSYDPAGNLKATTYPGGWVVKKQFDVRERLTNMQWDGGAQGFTYDAGSRLTQIQRANGADTFYERDISGRITNLLHTCTNGTLASVQLVRDSLGRVISKQIEGIDLPDCQLADEGDAAMGYNLADGLTTLNGQPVTLDLNGNVTNLVNTSSSCRYDALNRVTAITTPRGTTRLYYDPFDRLVRLEYPAQTYCFYYDDASRLLFAADEAGQPLWFAVYAGGRLQARGLPTTGLSYYHFSEMGHTMALTDTNGTIESTFSYTPFGMRNQGVSTNHAWFTLSGSYAVMDLQQGYYMMRHRIYQAALGRFLQRDPLGPAGGANGYAFADSDPVNGMDPFGLANWAYANDMNVLREEYNNQKYLEERDAKFQSMVAAWTVEKKEREQWRRDNPVTAWARDQVLSKSLAFATGGLSEIAAAYDKYQKGQYADIVLDRLPLKGIFSAGDLKSLLENFYEQNKQPIDLFKEPYAPAGDAPLGSFPDLGGGGGPQCPMESVYYY